jgi:hypothetical protein
MDIVTMREIVELCRYPEYALHVREDNRGAIYLHGTYLEPDVVTGNLEVQATRKWFLSPEMVKGEIVQTVFKCVMTSMEHRVREHFKYRERAIFGPHLVENMNNELQKLCEKLGGAQASGKAGE